jgi:hypothetical protein
VEAGVEADVEEGELTLDIGIVMFWKDFLFAKDFFYL